MKKKIITLLLVISIVLSCSASLAVGNTAEGATQIAPLSRANTVIDKQNNTILAVAGTTAEQLCDMFSGNGAVTLGGEAVSDTDVLKSGMMLTDGEDSMKISVLGDANADGKVSLNDVVAILKKAAKWNITIDECAADVNCDRAVSLNDATQILKYSANWDVLLGGADNVSLVFGNNIERYDRTDTEYGDKETAEMYVAKNEYEFTQFVVTTERDVADYTVSATPFTNENGESIRSELYYGYFYDVIDSGTKEILCEPADALVPVTKAMNFSADEFTPFAVKAFTEKDTAAGDYTATISVTDKNGFEYKRATVTLHVWDFVLPATSCRTSVGLESGSVSKKYTDPVYYEFCVENKLNPTTLPYDVSDPAAMKYITDERVNSFIVGGEGYGGQYDRTDEEVINAYNTLKVNEEWLKKAYFYYDDEPGPDGTMLNSEIKSLAREFASIEESYAKANRLFPNAKIVIPNHYNQDVDTAPSLAGGKYTGDIISQVIKYSNILCPHSRLFISTDETRQDALDQMYYTAQHEQQYGKLADRYAEKLASDENAELWWYTSDNPRDGFCNIHVTKTGIEARELFWQQYLYGAEGFLYWAISDWSVLQRRNTAYIGEYAGLLVYPGDKWDVDVPVASIRMEFVRDGIDDYDYLKLIEEKFGKETADAFVARITTSLLDYNKDADTLTNIRIEMGNLLAGK